jgi:hypothetical protein
MPELTSSDFWWGIAVGLVGGIFINLLSSDLHAWLPLMARKIARRAAQFRVFHPDKALTYGNKLAGSIDRKPEGTGISKLVVALSFWVAAFFARVGLTRYTPFDRADEVARYLDGAAWHAYRAARGIRGLRYQIHAIDPEAMDRFATELRHAADIAVDLARDIDATEPQGSGRRAGELVRAIIELQARLKAEDLAIHQSFVAGRSVASHTGSDMDLTIYLGEARHQAERLVQMVTTVK